FAEEYVRKTGDDVEVLGDRQQIQEREDDEIVAPPTDLRKQARGPRSRRRQHRCEEGCRRRPAPGRDLNRIRTHVDEAAGLEAEVGEHDATDEAENDERLAVRLLGEAILRWAETVESRRMCDEPPHQ